MQHVKTSFELDKHRWHPSVLPGQIVLVSSINQAGEPNLAPKSWVTMVAFKGPFLAFGCNTEHMTYQNIVATGCFVINIPGEQLARRIWSLPRHYGQERLQKSGFTLRPARKVKAPIIQQCKAHLECTLDSTKRYGDEVLVFGRLVAAYIDDQCRRGSLAEQYAALRPIFFLEDGTYASLDIAKQVDCNPPVADHRLYIIEVGAVQNLDDSRIDTLANEHESFIEELCAEGILISAGELSTQTEGAAVGEGTGSRSAMYILCVHTCAQADETARRDPLIQAGAPYFIKIWTRTY